MTLNHAWRREGWALRLGAGVVMAFPETSIRRRRQSHDEMGYTLTGPTFALGVGRSWSLGRRWLASGEAQLTRSFATVPVFDGEADVPNIALHGWVGVGYRFGR